MKYNGETRVKFKRTALSLMSLLATLTFVLTGCTSEEQKREEEAATAQFQAEILESIAESSKDDCQARGYTSYASGVCFRWLEKGDPRRDCGYSSGTCSVMEVSPEYGCNTLYVEVNIKDSSGAVIGYTNDVAKGIPAEGTALMQFTSFEKRANTVVPTAINCH